MRSDTGLEFGCDFARDCCNRNFKKPNEVIVYKKYIFGACNKTIRNVKQKKQFNKIFNMISKSLRLLLDI